MTTSDIAFLNDWASHPIGRAARIVLAVAGLVTSVFVLLLATLLPNGAWTMVLLGVALAATSVRAAARPTIFRLAFLAATMIAIPIVGQII